MKITLHCADETGYSDQVVVMRCTNPTMHDINDFYLRFLRAIGFMFPEDSEIQLIHNEDAEADICS